MKIGIGEIDPAPEIARDRLAETEEGRGSAEIGPGGRISFVKPTNKFLSICIVIFKILI